MHGGAGAIISIGLMNQLPIDFMERCVADISNGTGESFPLPNYPTLAPPKVSEFCMALVLSGRGSCAHWPGQCSLARAFVLAGQGNAHQPGQLCSAVGAVVRTGQGSCAHWPGQCLLACCYTEHLLISHNARSVA